MWKLLLVILLCYGVFLYWQSPLTKIVLGDHDSWINVQQPDSITLYIEQYNNLAVQEMKKNNIPASITLGQAILESRFGTSLLAQHANNHFGIKSNHSWDGNDRHCSYTYEWNNAKQNMTQTFACFRRYSNTAESFADHSAFLVTRPRYANLFKLPPTDWKAWAKGLQTAGYATDPQYAKKLIDLVKRYQLQRFDTSSNLPQPIMIKEKSTNISNIYPLLQKQ